VAACYRHLHVNSSDLMKSDFFIPESCHQKGKGKKKRNPCSVVLFLISNCPENFHRENGASWNQII